MMLHQVCRCLLLALPCVVLGTAAPNANRQLSIVADNPPALRGGLPWTRNLHRQHPIVALQSSQVTVRQSLVAVSQRRSLSGRKASSKRAASRHLRLRRTLTRHVLKHTQATGVCGGLKLKWWISIKKRCVKAYGVDSRWDRSKLDGQCSQAWDKCSTGFYAVCCNQPLGPKNLGAYCENKNLTGGSDASDEDKACVVQTQVAPLGDVIEGIKNTVKLMDEDVVEEQSFSLAPPAGPAPAPVPGPAMPPAGLMVAAAPAPAVVAAPRPRPPTKLESRCEKLTALAREAKEKIDGIKQWAATDGIKVKGVTNHKKHETGPQEIEEEVDKEIEEADVESPKAKDPDLVFSLEGVIKMGDSLECLLKDGKFCSGAPQEEEDDDDSIEEDLDKDPEKAWVSDHKADEEEDEEEEEETKVNETAVYNLLSWETEVTGAVNNFETKVHPHGYKWWRYRYEYTVIESIVLAFSVMVLYGMLWLLSGVSFFQKHKFYKTGLPQKSFRYAFVYLVFHATGLMCMVTLAYMLYIPWGKDNIFNVFATAFHDRVDGSMNSPFLGYSWLYMVLDVQFQLFATFLMYALFVAMVVHNYVGALRSWKNMADETHNPDSGGINVNLYRHLDSIVKRRLRTDIEYKRVFQQCKLRVPGVEGLDTQQAGWQDFKLHLLLTEALGKSSEYLVEVSLTTYIFLAISTLLVAVLAHHTQVAFMYFLPGFCFVGLVMFICGWCVSRYMRRLSDDDSYKKHSRWVTVHSFCRAVQILLYCLFFSFSRLLLSNDIFEQFTRVYLSALIGLVVILLLLAAFAGEVIKETACALVLPPHISQEELRTHLENIVYWHTHDNCHECGSIQMPPQYSYCKEWAGKKIHGDRPAMPQTGRPYSWRG